MKTLPDKSVDLFICDLPYGCLSSNKNNQRKRFIDGKDTGTILEGETIGGCEWDIKIDLDKFWIQVERLMKNEHTPIIQFCNTKFGYELIKSKEDWFRYDLVWDKMRGISFLSANKMPLKSHEMIYVFSKKGATYYRKDIEGDYPNTRRGKGTKPTNVYDVMPTFSSTTSTTHRCAVSIITAQTKSGKGQHPTAKPVDLYKFLIERYSNEGDTVLDPTFGSGNSGLASIELKRKYIGIEKDEKFFNAFSTKNEK
jgi:site-specific DNA-methyltransferase (adenine-specific)